MGAESHLQISEPPEPGSRTADSTNRRRTNPWLYFVLLAFGTAGLVRAVPFHILTPDSGDYLVAARSLVTGNGYRDLSSAGNPPFTWRPPGLPVLLMPSAAVSLDSSSTAKGLIVLYGILLLWCLYQYASRLVGADWALFPVLLVATSPQMLVYSTEVLSEVPFTAALVGLLCLAHDWEAGRTSRWRACTIGLLLIALPMLRTVGAPIVGVWLLWSLTARHRRLLLVPAVTAIGALAAWSVYLSFAGGSRYDSLIAKVIESEGLFKFALGGVVNLLTYLPELNHELFPGFLSDSYVEIVTDREFSPLFGRHTTAIVSILGMVVLSGASAGMLWKPGSARWLTALTLLAYLATVCLYPLRSERLLWPAVPVLWVLFVAGTLAALARVKRPSAPQQSRAAVAAVVLIALAAIQLRDWPGMLRPAWRYWTHRDEFYAAGDYPRYYADWRSAAKFLRAHSRPDEGVVTLIKEFYTLSERRQERLEIGRSPNEIAEMIESNRIRWLAIGHGYSRRAMERLLWHPRYAFVQRYHNPSDYQLYEVLPNRAGSIPLSIMEPRNEPKDPAQASLWDQAGTAFRRRDFDTCVRSLRKLHQFASLPTSYLLLGRAEARRGAFEEARLCYRRMRLIESSESFAREIVDGVREVEILEELALPATSEDRRTALGVELATLHVNWGRFDEAWEQIESLKQSCPQSGALWAMEGRLLDWTGRAQLAEDAFSEAVKLGDRPAEELLLTRRLARALASHESAEVCAGTLHEFTNPDDARGAIQLAARWRKEGLAGRSLAVLEQAVARFPGNKELQRALAEALDYFGLQSAETGTGEIGERSGDPNVAKSMQDSPASPD